MPTDATFLALIRESPSDRTPRLVYADWLEERNDPRAELVRVCEAMRTVPVWSDRYWQLKARRNELWECVPLEWLEATGYDGSDYDPIFRDGVPDGWRERWRLIREFTERWHGIAVPDVGGRKEEVRREEERLGMELPPSVREFVAYSSDLDQWGEAPIYPQRFPTLFHCAGSKIEHLSYHPALSLIYFSLSSCVLGVAHADLHNSDPRTFFFSERSSPEFSDRSVSLSVFRDLFQELPSAAWSDGVNLESPDDHLNQLAVDLPFHARFDDADVYETNELLICVGGPGSRYGRARERWVNVVVRRPIPSERVPSYLFGPDDWHWFSQQLEEERCRTGPALPHRWMSIFRRREAERLQEEADLLRAAEQAAAPNPPEDGGYDDIPF